jgi:glycogen debranching enzyme
MGRMEPATTGNSVTLVEHANFAVSDRAGDILPGSYHGFFVSDTRVLSRFVVRVNRKRLEPLASGADEHHGAGTFYLANPRLPGIPAATIAVFRDRRISSDLSERIRLISYAAEPIEIELTLEIDADFADIFEVRGRRPMRRRITARHRPREVRFAYRRPGFARTTSVALNQPAAVRDHRAGLRVILERGVPWDLVVTVQAGGSPASAGDEPPIHRMAPRRVRKWLRSAPVLRVNDRRLADAWRQGVRDIGSLLLTGPEGNVIPAAGLPWFLALFGRDSCITAIQSNLLGSELAIGTLQELARYQGSTVDRWREEEPGKIPHEVRSGELATLGTVPHGRYYGSVDATPLYLMLYVDACRRSGMLDGAPHRLPPALKRLLPHAEAALEWIERRADPDGFIWYGPTARGGIRNQVWKDSNDSMRYRDGATAVAPIAAVEVQGYVVAARRGMAQVYRALGQHAEADRQHEAATRLAALIDQVFWMPDEGIHALGLDADRRKIDGIGTNAGHLLWARVLPAKRANAVSERLMAPDLFSGWGIRTLSNRNPAFNPIGYHTGSVWPHENSLIADGMARAGAIDRARRLIDALLDAAHANPVDRLPELFAGFDRAATPDLVPYPAACAPQAWATGAIFQIASTLIETGLADERWSGLRVDGVPAGAWPGAA